MTTEAEVRVGRTRSHEMQEKARKGYSPGVSRRKAAPFLTSDLRKRKRIDPCHSKPLNLW